MLGRIGLIPLFLGLWALGSPLCASELPAAVRRALEGWRSDVTAARAAYDAAFERAGARARQALEREHRTAIRAGDEELAASIQQLIDSLAEPPADDVGSGAGEQPAAAPPLQLTAVQQALVRRLAGRPEVVTAAEWEALPGDLLQAGCDGPVRLPVKAGQRVVLFPQPVDRTRASPDFQPVDWRGYRGLGLPVEFAHQLRWRLGNESELVERRSLIEVPADGELEVEVPVALWNRRVASGSIRVKVLRLPP